MFMKNSLFWDITSCNPLKVKQHLEVTCRHHLLDRRTRQASNQRESRWQAEVLTWLILRHWRWRWYVTPKSQLPFNGLHGVISQKTELLIWTLSCWNVNPFPSHGVPRYQHKVMVTEPLRYKQCISFGKILQETGRQHVPLRKFRSNWFEFSIYKFWFWFV
jgi:hypothetical protein